MAVLPPPVTPSSRIVWTVRSATACSIAATAADCSGLSSLPAGRPPRVPGDRAASGRRGASRTSISTKPRRISPATVEEPWRARQLGGGQALRRAGIEIGQERLLARAEPAFRLAPLASVSGRRRTKRIQRGPAPAASSVQSRSTRPCASRARRRRRSAGRPSGATSERTWRGPAARPSRISTSAGIEPGIGVVPGLLRAAFRDELQPLEHARREHGPQRDRRRRKVVVGDPRREAHAELGQERPIGPHPIEHGLRLDTRHQLARTEHDPQRLSAPELDEHGFAGSEIRQGFGNAVRVRPDARAACRVDSDRDEPLGGHELRRGCVGRGSRPSRRG